MIPDAMRDRLEALVRGDRVVLFMKGTREAPRCGFSARVVEQLDAHLETYVTVDVLDDANLREAVKAWSSWPTFPQLYVDGELVGGADIVAQLAEQGELAGVLRAAPTPAPTITLTPAAAQRIREVVGPSDVPLRLRIDAAFRYQFEEVDEPGPADVVVDAGGVRLVLDRTSARRADGMTMDYVVAAHGAGLVVENPNEPAKVTPLDVTEYARWRERGQPHLLLDVRTDEEWAIARIEGAQLLDERVEAVLEQLPKDTPLVFQCHHGVRSRHAAEHFLGRGFRKVFNLTGGIDAWSARVDPSVPRY